MNSLYTRLDALLRSDAGARGFSANAGAADMDALVIRLLLRQSAR